MIPLHLPPGDTSQERTVQIDGSSEQIEAAKQLVYEVISEVCVIGHHFLFFPASYCENIIGSQADELSPQDDTFNLQLFVTVCICILFAVCSL